MSSFACWGPSGFKAASGSLAPDVKINPPTLAFSGGALNASFTRRFIDSAKIRVEVKAQPVAADSRWGQTCVSVNE